MNSTPQKSKIVVRDILFGFTFGIALTVGGIGAGLTSSPDVSSAKLLFFSSLVGYSLLLLMTAKARFFEGRDHVDRRVFFAIAAGGIAGVIAANIYAIAASFRTWAMPGNGFRVIIPVVVFGLLSVVIHRRRFDPER